MKRGKDEEKVMGPMFPRIHVNDTEKGGPRAPPRNKMALYEQLSIPSQRFKPGMVPISPNDTSNLIPPASSSQGSSHQKAVLFSPQHPSSRQSAEKADSCYFDSNAPFVQLEQKKKSEEDDFRVPIFMQPSLVQDSGRNCYSVDREKSFPSTEASIPHSTKHLPNADTVARQMPISGHNVRYEDRSHQNEENLKGLTATKEQPIKAVSDSSSIKYTEVALTKNNTCLHHELVDSSVNNCSRLQRTDSLLPENRADSHPTRSVNGGAILNGPKRGNNNGDPSVPMWDNHSEEQRILDDAESHEDKTCGSLLTGIADRDVDNSETSMVDSISGLDISPDDVVGIIGQKHFWKARRAIVNQQRVFAVQIFELHRLVKVQKLIAGSPHLLLESNSYLGKPIKASSPKKIPLEYIVKGSPNAVKLKNESEKQNQKVECSAENTLGKASLSSVLNGSQLPSHKPFSVNSPTAVDQTYDSWCFHQPQGQQWLVPVMSPSEGLVYKPYPGPGFMAQVCGGCGPPGAAPMMGNFMSPAYGVPASHHYQGMGVPPFAASAGPHGYFPPCGLPVLNQANSGSAVDQSNQFASSGFHGQSPGVGANSNIQHQNSSIVPGQRNRANRVAPDAMKLPASRDSELQVSTASSPSERTQGTGRGNSIGASNVLPRFPTSPVIDGHNNTTQSQNGDQHAGVIKVVPHNRRSATESAARIFQSIQQERKQYDSV